MPEETGKFAALFRKYRLKAEFSTLSEIGLALAEKGLIYEDSIFSHWQHGTRIPQSRNILIKLIEIFVERHALTTLDQANEFLSSAHQGYLSDTEAEFLLHSSANTAKETIFASLGGLLKDFRTQKHITSEEVAMALGWNDTSQLNRIEQGINEKPPRDLIDHICKALELKEQEKNNLLLAGNYLPTKQEIEKVRRENESYVETWPYPINLYDFCWRLILINKKTMRMLGMSEADRQYMYDTTPTAIEVVFDPNFIQNRLLKDDELPQWHANLYRFLTHFKNLQKSIAKDSWYLDMMKRMMKNDLFREIWKKVRDSETTFLTTRYGEKFYVHPKDTNRRLHFNIFVVPLLKDPRFELEFFNPADAETAAYFKSPA